MEDDQELTGFITHGDTENLTQKEIRRLVQAVLDNNKELTAKLLQSDYLAFSIQNIPDKLKIIITFACDSPKVSKDVFEVLLCHVLKNDRYVNLTAQSWYYWEPIHFASYNIDVGKLKIIISNIDKSRINALTIFSENALHVLLEYGKRVEPFWVQLSNGWECRLCHVLPEEHKELIECANELILAGIDVNHINIWNETPLIIAIRYRLIRIIELLLQQRDIDLDTVKDHYTRKSARDLLRENDICVNLLSPTTSVVHSPTRILFTYLKSDDEELFLRYNNENIRQYANDLDGDNEINTSGNMLQLCLLKGYIEYAKKGTSTQEDDRDIMSTSMLKVFCQKGFVRSIEHLLNNRAEISGKNRIFKYLNVVQAAVRLSYYPFIAVLLQHKSNQMSKHDIIDALKYTVNISSFVDFKSNHLRHVLYLFVSKLEIFNESSTVIDYESQVVLNSILDFYLAKQNKNKNYRYQENICQFLRLGASLISRERGFTRLKKIEYATLNAHLDECIDVNNNVCYNSFILDEATQYSETEALYCLTHDPQKIDLLNHPALIDFIHAKWLQNCMFLYWNMAFYMMFLFSLYIHMVSLHIGDVKPVLFYAFMVLLVIHTLKELAQLVFFRSQYFLDLFNYPEIGMIISCCISIFSKNEISMVIAILLSTLLFLLMLGQFPRFTKYMIIFSSTRYFLEYAMFYFIQFFSFALCFFILLPPNTEGSTTKSLEEIFINLFDTLIFFIGQLEGPVAQPQEFPIFGRIVVAIFIFCMTIILNNLLVGLIVTDMDVIQKTSKLLRQVKLVKYINRIEMIMKKIDKDRFLGLQLGWRKTNIFQAKCKKSRNLIYDGNIFDEEDKAWLKKIHENRRSKQDVLKQLYEYIVSEVYGDDGNRKGNKDILSKLARLEEQLSKLRS